MAIENLPIPAENATIARGQIYQLTGLTEATRYKFIVTSTKCPHVVIAKDEALEQGIVTGKNLRGTLIFSQGTALGAGQRAAVASFQIPTGGDAGTFKGTAVITFVGNIA